MMEGGSKYRHLAPLILRRWERRRAKIARVYDRPAGRSPETLLNEIASMILYIEDRDGNLEGFRKFRRDLDVARTAMGERRERD